MSTPHLEETKSEACKYMYTPTLIMRSLPNFFPLTVLYYKQRKPSSIYHPSKPGVHNDVISWFLQYINVINAEESEKAGSHQELNPGD